jgi:hypothetical protein
MRAPDIAWLGQAASEVLEELVHEIETGRGGCSPELTPEQHKTLS